MFSIQRARTNTRNIYTNFCMCQCECTCLRVCVDFCPMPNDNIHARFTAQRPCTFQIHHSPAPHFCNVLPNADAAAMSHRCYFAAATVLFE